jgi:hypothetical protein
VEDPNAVSPAATGLTRQPRYTIVQVSDPHLPAEGFMSELVALRDPREIVITFVPVTGRDEILYEVQADESRLGPTA